jgi:hypothetical protein
MKTKDGFALDDPLPLFLSDDKPEQGIGSDRAVISLRLVTASILVATATAIGISIPSARNPVTLFADVAASVGSSAPQPGPDESMPSIQSAQSTADAEALQTVKEVPTSSISAPEIASQTQAENSDASAEALFREYQAWRAEQRAHDMAKPVQDDPASLTKDVPEPAPRVQKQRTARTVRNARLEVIRRVRKRRANLRRQNERAQAGPVQDAQAQTQSVQYAEPPSFLERLNPFGASAPQR